MGNEREKALSLANTFFRGDVFDMSDLELHENRKIAIENSITCVQEILMNIEATILYHKDSKSLPINNEFWVDVLVELNNM